jgi:hypothetical protein
VAVSNESHSVRLGCNRLSGRRGRPPAHKETSSVIARHSVYNSFRVEETEIEM